jgi:hypothetical protein
MPESSLQIRVSQRELDRPRLIEAVAYGRTGARLPGVAVHLRIDLNGSFDDDSERTERVVVTSNDGSVHFQWYEYPRGVPRRDFTSTIHATWDREDAFVVLQDLYE